MKGMQRLAWVAAGAIGLHAVSRLARRWIHVPVPAFLGPFLDSRIRRWMQPPERVIARSGLRPGMRILEIGCGSGAYTVLAARTVGPRGEVMALDVQQGMLDQLIAKLRRAENADVGNVTMALGDAEDLPFPDNTFDLVMLVTALPEIPDQARALGEIRRVLRPKGVLAVTEFLPDPDYPLATTTIRRGLDAGFVVEALAGNLWTYTVRFRPAPDIAHLRREEIP
jgi:ubiquinone/menaquinone biosynthesis C-methylase UbiE